MTVRVSVWALALALLGCAPEVTVPATPPPPGAPAPVPPPPPGPSLRRPDGIVYGGAGGVGVGLSRPSTSATVSPGFAAVGSLIVGLSLRDWAIIGLRVDASVASGDGLGDIGAHVAVFPGADGRGAIRDLQFFGEACVGGPLSQSGAGTSSSVTGLGRIGVAWERWTVTNVGVGPFLAGQFARSANDAQASALVGVSINFSANRGAKPAAK